MVVIQGRRCPFSGSSAVPQTAGLGKALFLALTSGVTARRYKEGWVITCRSSVILTA